MGFCVLVDGFVYKKKKIERLQLDFNMWLVLEIGNKTSPLRLLALTPSIFSALMF